MGKSNGALPLDSPFPKGVRAFGDAPPIASGRLSSGQGRDQRGEQIEALSSFDLYAKCADVVSVDETLDSLSPLKATQ